MPVTGQALLNIFNKVSDYGCEKRRKKYQESVAELPPFPDSWRFRSNRI